MSVREARAWNDPGVMDTSRVRELSMHVLQIYTCIRYEMNQKEYATGKTMKLLINHRVKEKTAILHSRCPNKKIKFLSICFRFIYMCAYMIYMCYSYKFILFG